MERRRALVVAGTMTATLAMAGTAMAVNMGLLGSDRDPVGDLTATEIQPAAQREARPTAAERTPRVRVVVQDIPVAAGGGNGGGTYTGTVESGDDDAPAPTAAPAPAPTAPYVDDDDDSSYDDHRDDHDDEDSDDSVDEPDDDHGDDD